MVKKAVKEWQKTTAFVIYQRMKSVKGSGVSELDGLFNYLEAVDEKSFFLQEVTREQKFTGNIFEK